MATLPVNSPAIDLSGKIAGGVLGGIIGGLFGPVGVIAGRAIGSRLGQMAARAAAASIAQMMEEANEDAEEETKDEEAEKVCADCAEIDCFEPPEGMDREEFERQLKEQQDAINDMNPNDLIRNMENFANSGRPAGDAAARRLARRQWTESRNQELFNQFIKHMSPAEAEAAAQTQTTRELSSLDATHNVDLVAGGDGTISGLGNSTVNRSIGSQWKGKRAAQLKDAAEKRKQAGKDKIGDIKLEICPEESKNEQTPSNSNGNNGPGNSGPGDGPPLIG